jgi:hypothetical protein
VLVFYKKTKAAQAPHTIRLVFSPLIEPLFEYTNIKSKTRLLLQKKSVIIMPLYWNYQDSRINEINIKTWTCDGGENQKYLEEYDDLCNIQIPHGSEHGDERSSRPHRSSMSSRNISRLPLVPMIRCRHPAWRRQKLRLFIAIAGVVVIATLAIAGVVAKNRSNNKATNNDKAMSVYSSISQPSSVDVVYGYDSELQDTFTNGEDEKGDDDGAANDDDGTYYDDDRAYYDDDDAHYDDDVYKRYNSFTTVNATANEGDDSANDDGHAVYAGDDDNDDGKNYDDDGGNNYDDDTGDRDEDAEDTSSEHNN